MLRGAVRPGTTLGATAPRPHCAVCAARDALARRRRLVPRACPALVRTARSPSATHATVGLGTSTTAQLLPAATYTFSRESVALTLVRAEGED